MTVEENKAMCRHFIESTRKGDFKKNEDKFADDFVDHHPALGNTPDFKGLIKSLKIMQEAFSDVEIFIEDQFGEGDKVFMRTKVNATHTGEFAGISPTGNRVSYYSNTVLHIKEGKVVERWNMTDGLGLLLQLGVKISK